MCRPNFKLRLWDHFSLRPQKRGGLLGTGGGGGGGRNERVGYRPKRRIPPEKDRRDRGPPPDLNNRFSGSVKPVLNWANVCSPEHTSDTSTNYDSFLN